jgi:tetratricopeptide (TPR) repeat protein
MSEAAKRAGCSLLCSNVDPATGSTWGTHENYQCVRKNHAFMSDQLYPHLVTRIIYAGAGGLDQDFAGVRLLLSPRAGLTRRSRSCQGYPCKTLVFDKPEAYCEGFRLHILCGESLLCHTASYLKYATTALVAYGLDHALFPGPGSLACPPTRALRTLNRDLSLSVKLPFQNGLRLTALETQQFYLESITEKISRYPKWAPRAVKRWRQMLNDLWRGDARCATQVDWMVYRNLLGKLASEYGYDDAALRAVNRALAAGQTIDDPARLSDFKAAAQALYVKLHVLGKESLFQKLEAESALAGDTHRLPEITDEVIQTAMKEPPPGRASHRAVLIRKYRNLPEYEISWDLLFDLKLRRRLEIPQALHWDGEEAWKEDAKNIYTTCKTAATLFRQGEFVKVVQLLDPAFASADFFLRERAYSDLCLSYARLGMKDHVEKILEANKGRYFGSPFEESVFVLFCAVNYGLCPPLNILEPLLKQCESLRAERQSDTYTVGHDDFVFQQNKTVVLLGKGDATGAEQLCRTLLIPRENLTRTRMTARTRCHLAKALYAQGRLEEARQALLPATKCHADERPAVCENRAKCCKACSNRAEK